MEMRFNPPPGWPALPSSGWSPPPGWTPDPGWPAAPASWQWWVSSSSGRSRAEGTASTWVAALSPLAALPLSLPYLLWGAPSSSASLWVGVIGLIACAVDWRAVREGKFGLTRWMALWALLTPLVYLVLRARALGQSQRFTWIWVGCLALSVVLAP